MKSIDEHYPQYSELCMTLIYDVNGPLTLDIKQDGGPAAAVPPPLLRLDWPDHTNVPW